MSTDNINTLKELLEQSGEFLDDFINIILVYFGGRKTFLFETANHTNNYSPEQSMKIIEEFITKLSNSKTLHIQLDRLSNKKFPRFFISLEKIDLPKSHKEVGKILGFYCFDHDYSNYYEDRITGSINVRFGDYIKEGMYVEVGEIRRVDEEKFANFLKEKISKWNQVMKDLDLDIEFKYEINIAIGIENLKYAVQIEDIEYIMNNTKEYYDYFDNFGSTNILHYYNNIIDTLEENFRVFKNLFFICYPDQERGNLYEDYILDLNADDKLVKYLEKKGVDYYSSVDAHIDLDNIMKKL